MERIVIIGSSCAGKSTLGAQLGERLGIKHTQLDELHWLPDWVERDDDEFVQLVTEYAAEDRWVMDGNYQVARPHLWPRATTIIWLNYSFSRVLWRSLKRSIMRIVTREELFSGNRESFRLTFMSKDSIILWVITSFHRKRRDYPRLLESDMAANAEVKVLHSPRETAAFLKSL
jgi:adenylate kinase family enzyme